MGKSSRIIKTLIADLKKYIASPDITYEAYRELPDDLESRQVGMRIALFAESEDTTVKVGAFRASDSIQRYGIDISIDRAYRHDDETHGEYPALNLKDFVVDWLRNVDAFNVTGGALNSIGYEGSSGFVRRKRYITLSLRISGQRDLLTTQKED